MVRGLESGALIRSRRTLWLRSWVGRKSRDQVQIPGVGKDWLDYESYKLDIQPRDGHNSGQCFDGRLLEVILADSHLNSSWLNICLAFRALNSLLASSIASSALDGARMILVL